MLKPENQLIHHNARLINLWNFTNPIMIDSEYNEKAFYADFYCKQHVYRFSFIAFKGTKEEANNILSEYIENVRFYDDEIDLKRLQEAVRKGVNEY